ncbi:hypothetical protein [Carnobacterium divergens]|uniref:hypothetical protein n=1 Tax=Carnobacterium divergens TaxID=2748 RepID=UPI0007F45034|nr:hypothetical protein [Carnobacterium divergens]SBO17631.1 hypothetical protein CDIV41_320192 [Carnobacterium divergens]
MKVFAVEISPNGNASEIYIDRALMLRKTDNAKFKTKKYYTINSYQKNSKNIYNELVPVNGKKNNFFKYKIKPNKDDLHNKDDDLLSHSIAQDVISSLTTLNISLDRTEATIVIPIKQAFTEYRIDTSKKKV